ncbi:hypothetical protein BD414DRAFT_547018 [Trametes punicea]|nr:hypothetical protein BD414DRAFT_547018 [Trametes punicea]
MVQRKTAKRNVGLENKKTNKKKTNGAKPKVDREPHVALKRAVGALGSDHWFKAELQGCLQGKSSRKSRTNADKTPRVDGAQQQTFPSSQHVDGREVAISSTEEASSTPVTHGFSTATSASTFPAHHRASPAVHPAYSGTTAPKSTALTTSSHRDSRADGLESTSRSTRRQAGRQSILTLRAMG